jgi:hypothetical protein
LLIESDCQRLNEKLAEREANGGEMMMQLQEYVEINHCLERNEIELLQQHEQLQNRVEVLEEEKRALVAQLNSLQHGGSTDTSSPRVQLTLAEASAALAEQTILMDQAQSTWARKEAVLTAEIESLKTKISQLQADKQSF